MKVVPDIQITESMVLANNIPETDYPDWASGVSYIRGDIVQSTTTHTEYLALTDHTSDANNNPDVEAAALADPLVDDPSPVNWTIIGATNPFRLFDRKPSVVATRADSIQVTIAPGQIFGGISAHNVTCGTVTIDVRDGATVVYSRTVEMQDNSGITDGWEYFFSEFQELPEFYFTDIPPYAGAEIDLTFEAIGSTVSVGQISIGPVWNFGYVQLGQSGFNGLDFSQVEVDQFGNLARAVRSATEIHNFDVVMQAGQVLSFKNRMKDLRGAAPATWIGDDDRNKGAAIYGFLRSNRTIYVEGDHVTIALEVQGLT